MAVFRKICRMFAMALCALVLCITFQSNSYAAIATKTCSAGYYLPASIGASLLKAQNAQVCTICPVGVYCPGGTFAQLCRAEKIGGGYSCTRQGYNSCPDATLGGSTQIQSNKYPSNWYASENMTFTRMEYLPWVTGITNINGCVVRYNGKNDRGTFENEGAYYDSSTGRYDNIRDKTFYKMLKPGYYGYQQYYDSSHSCYSGDDQWAMIYQYAYKCESGYYCPGFYFESDNPESDAVPRCSDTNYNYSSSILGRYSCPSGYSSSASGSSANTQCYRSCTTSDKSQSTSVSGYFYYGQSTSSNSCTATACNSGYHVSSGSCVGNTYTVTFNANGGSGGQSSSVTATYGSAMPSISTTKPTKDGYTFAGWSIN